jgi:hypothetical protein
MISPFHLLSLVFFKTELSPKRIAKLVKQNAKVRERLGKKKSKFLVNGYGGLDFLVNGRLCCSSLLVKVLHY